MKTILIDLVKTRMLDWCSIHGVAIYDLYVDYLRYNRRGEPRVFLNNEGGVNSIFEDYDAFSIIQIAKALDIESIGDMRANAFIGYDANGNVKCEDDLSYFVNTQEIAEWFVNNANNFVFNKRYFIFFDLSSTWNVVFGLYYYLVIITSYFSKSKD